MILKDCVQTDAKGRLLLSNSVAILSSNCGLFLFLSSCETWSPPTTAFVPLFGLLGINCKTCFWNDKPIRQSRGEHFSRENPRLNPISHFSGPNSIPFQIHLAISKFLNSHFQFLISHSSLLISNFLVPTSCKKLR